MDKTEIDHLQELYLNAIPIRPRNTKETFAVGMIGLVGSGKSTVAKEIARRLGLFVASNDAIRRFLNTQGYPGSSPMQEAVQSIAIATSRHLFAQHISHIIDADLIKFHVVARQEAAAAGAKLFLLHIHCPESVTLDRLRRRQAGSGGDEADLSQAGEGEYEIRKNLHRTIAMPQDIVMAIDTSQPLGLQVDEFVAMLQSQGVL